MHMREPALQGRVLRPSLPTGVSHTPIQPMSPRLPKPLQWRAQQGSFDPSPLCHALWSCPALPAKMPYPS